MELFWKTAAVSLIAAILSLSIGKQEKDIAVLLTMVACCIVAAAAATFLEPVLDLLRELEATAQLRGDILGTLLKCTGIALVAEIAGLICTDAGSGSLGKGIQLLGSTVILYLSIPMVRALLTLIREIFGNI